MALWDLMDLLLNPSYDKDYPHQMEAVRKRVASVAERELFAFAKEGEVSVDEIAVRKIYSDEQYARDVRRAAAEAGYASLPEYIEPRKVARVRIRVKPPKHWTLKAKRVWWSKQFGWNFSVWGKEDHSARASWSLSWGKYHHD